MQDNDAPPDVTEQYTSATNASNLRVEMDAERRSSADILMAAAWSPSRLGAALLRLHSEWDRSQHPRRMTSDAIDRLALTLEAPKDCPPERRASMQQSEAFRTANQWYQHEVALVLQRLKTLPEVRAQLVFKAEDMGCGNSKEIAAKVLMWWLSKNCQSCHGTKFEVAAGTGRQTGKVCRSCRGSGQAPIPCWEPGRELANYLDDAVNQARTQIRNRLHGTRQKVGQQS